jgi:ribosomal protein S27AE
MIKISRGIILVIIGIILYFPVAKVFQIFLPSSYGLILTLLGPGLLIAGVVLVIKDRKSPNANQEIISDQTEFCGKCGNEISRKNTFCTKCGTESKD